MCHQTVSLVARHLEAVGIPTVVVGSARDIVEECGVPRFVFVDFPLGNPCGKPYDPEMQRSIVMLALRTLESAIAPRTTVQAPERWGSEDWRHNYMLVSSENAAQLREAGERRRQAQRALRNRKR